MHNATASIADVASDVVAAAVNVAASAAAG